MNKKNSKKLDRNFMLRRYFSTIDRCYRSWPLERSSCFSWAYCNPPTNTSVYERNSKFKHLLKPNIFKSVHSKLNFVCKFESNAHLICCWRIIRENRSFGVSIKVETLHALLGFFESVCCIFITDTNFILLSYSKFLKLRQTKDI